MSARNKQLTDERQRIVRRMRDITQGLSYMASHPMNPEVARNYLTPYAQELNQLADKILSLPLDYN